MRAAVFTDIGTIRMQDVPTPRPAPHEALVRVRVAGVCGSEVHIFLGTHPWRKPPAILGHEMSGDVVEVGSEVDSVRPGDRVTLVPFTSCGRCLYCREGSPYLCVQKVLIGTPGWTGAFGEYVVAPESNLLRLPAGFSYEQGMMIEPVAVAVHAVRRARVGLGKSVLVLGAGTVGLCCISASRAAGATTVIATDVVDFNLNLARRLGAGATVNVREGGDLERVVAEQAGPYGVDVAFVAAGFSSVVNQAIARVRKRGLVALVAQFDEPITIPNPFQVVSREVEILGILQYVAEDFDTAIDLIGSGAVDVGSLITNVLPIEEAQRALRIVAHKTEDSAKVVLTF